MLQINYSGQKKDQILYSGSGLLGHVYQPGPADQELGFAWHISLWDLKIVMQYQKLIRLLLHVVEKKLSLKSIHHMILDAIP